MIESKKGFFLLSLIFILLVAGCFPSHKTQTRNYKDLYTASDTVPDYSDLKFWAAHPYKQDPSDSIPPFLRKEERDSSVDVFFLYPTSLTDPKLEGVTWNAAINDAALNAKTDYSSILYQASIFNGSCRVFAPRYRQAHIYSFFSTDTAKNNAALAFAYEDVKAAFLYYLQHYNNGRPIILAGHSQGTVHAAHLLKDFFENTSPANKLVAAYLTGMGIPQNYFSSIPICDSANQTNCFVSWRTFREGYVADYVKKETTPVAVVNPLSWTTTDRIISRKQNRGSVLYNFKKEYKHANGARIANNVIWTNRPKFLFGFLIKTKNYHVGDYNLFYRSVRENVKMRIASYIAKEKSSK